MTILIIYLQVLHGQLLEAAPQMHMEVVVA